MADDRNDIARKEIHETLKKCNWVVRRIGLSFIDEPPVTLCDKFVVILSLATALVLVFTMLMGEFAFTASLVATHVSLEEFLGSYIHIAGYDTMIYSLNTFVGLWGYNLTPIFLHLYHQARGVPSSINLIWHIYYPFDTEKVFGHTFAYIFEVFAGVFSVFSMVGADLLFITMASHISMLLRLLQIKIRKLGKYQQYENSKQYMDCYSEIVEVVKIHQRLISYGNDLEDAFSAVNLINLLLSSVNLCCCLFNVVFLNPWEEVNDKIFVIIALAQMGMICWYADDISRASVGVADAVFESGWYKSNARCRRALLVLLQRSQKPLYFTALKFKMITMMTYGSFLTTSYSYFTLLYTSYRRN